MPIFLRSRLVFFLRSTLKSPVPWHRRFDGNFAEHARDGSRDTLLACIDSNLISTTIANSPTSLVAPITRTRKTGFPVLE
ncbi:MAG: hypothetical protein OXC26_19155 [Albidovulum sp.]|nr:hypothetical protein [Albidovulum sp.]